MGLPIATLHATRELRGAPRVRRHRDTEERAELKTVSALAPAESRIRSLADHKARSSNDWVRAMQRVCDPSAIMDVDAGPAPQRTSRKHQLSSDGDNSNCSSDESGRFDDAEEAELDDYRSPSTKSVKRRRSNDWPLPEEAADYGQHDRRNARSGNVVLGATYRASPRVSPRGSATSLRGRYKSNSHSPHHRLGRRSRFVEATMSDSVSEKPPSIFLRDGRPPGASNRQLGIFRFGKAIASAFNPFGGWGKSSPENASKTEPQKDALTQAEEAYAELKKAGFKGTNKGAYLQSQSVDPTRADQTWQAIQEKMGYGAGTGQPSWPSMAQEPSTPSRSSSKASKRSSLQDLRRAKSLSIPFMKPHESPVMAPSHLEPTSEDSEVPGVRRQKSRKELSRQAKLLKKVSNLEDKLERARRELRQLSGNEQRTPAPLPETKLVSMEMDPGSYPRKFVPGALPTLPSERLLDQQATVSESPEIEPGQLTALPSIGCRGSISVDKAFPVDNVPAARSSPGTRRTMGKESSSRKRKPPVPEPIASRNPVQPRPTDRFNDDRFEHEQLIDVGLLSPPRQAKWQKMEAGDSPGSVERQRNTDPGALTTAQEGGVKHKRSPYVSSRRSSPSIVRSPKSKTIRSPPPLRMRQARSHLPSLSPSNPDVLAESAITRWFSPSPPPDVAHDTFYLQQHRQLDPDRTPRSSPSSLTGVSRKRRSVPDADIPPVPPLPKDLLMNAARVNSSPAKVPKPGNHRAAADHSPRPSSVQSQQSPGLKDFLWPEDIF